MAGKTGKGALAWAMYDWADSAFACTIIAAVLPIFYRDVASAGHPQASSFWAYTQSLTMLVVAVLAPILGAIADQSAARIKFMRFFVYLGELQANLRPYSALLSLGRPARPLGPAGLELFHCLYFSWRGASYWRVLTCKGDVRWHWRNPCHNWFSHLRKPA